MKLYIKDTSKSMSKRKGGVGLTKNFKDSNMGGRAVIKKVMPLAQIFSTFISPAIQYSIIRWGSDNITVSSYENKSKRPSRCASERHIHLRYGNSH